MKYSIFNNTKIIELPDDLINMYEKYRGKLNDIYIEHMAMAYESNKDSSIEEIKVSVIEAMKDEIEVICKAPEVIKMAIQDEDKIAYFCFNDTKLIKLPKTLVSFYEKIVGEMNGNRIEYHIISSNGLETDSEQAMTALAIYAIIEEISVYQQIPNVIEQMKINGDLL